MSGILAMLVGAGSAFTFIDNITADLSNYNLRTRAIAAGWDQIIPLSALVTVAPGVVVSASSTANYALDTGTTAYPPGSRMSVVTAGAYVVGMGGAGSAIGGGAAGGPAVRVNLPTTWDNAGGTVGSGGGGGGRGGSREGLAFSGKDPVPVYGYGGQGGGARTGRTNAAPNGTFAAAGAGLAGTSQTVSSLTVTGGPGGPGGGWGSAGSTGGSGSGGSLTSGPYSGGAAGVCIVGNAYITWGNPGTRLGAIT